MISIEIDDIKLFMNKLLKTTTFDDFEVVSIDVATLSKYTIDGAINNAFLSSDEKEILEDREYIKWSEIKDTVLFILKGSKTPTNIKLVFALSKKATYKTIEKANSNLTINDINGFYININFENNVLKAVTGTNYKLFTMDKSVEQFFDKSMLKFFSNNEIIVSTVD
jgi:hypothetical protein